MVLSFRHKKNSTLILKKNSFDFDIDVDKPTHYFDIYLKDLNTARVSPPRYIYHVTDYANLDNILKNGLKTKMHTHGNWKGQSELYYPPSLFAVTDYTYWINKISDPVVIRIDTKKCDNKWQYDINFFNPKDSTEAIMTFKDIPPECLKHIDIEQ